MKTEACDDTATELIMSAKILQEQFHYTSCLYLVAIQISYG
jgi:hypothetical protein